jgi:hypothetical protein
VPDFWINIGEGGQIHLIGADRHPLIRPVLIRVLPAE